MCKEECEEGEKALVTYEFTPMIVVEVQARGLSEAEQALRTEMIGLELEGRISMFLGSGSPINPQGEDGPVGLAVLGDVQ